MSPRKPVNDGTEETIFAEENDSEDSRTFEPEGAEKVREGLLSAAQLPEGNGNVDPTNPDAQYPPGVVQNSAQLPSPEDVRAMVPERKLPLGEPVESVRTTAATPDYGTNTEE